MAPVSTVRLLVLIPMLAALAGASYWILTDVHGTALESHHASAIGARPESEPANVPAAPRPAPPRTEGRLQIDYDTKAYPVSGTTVDEVLASLRENGPQSDVGRFFGLTETSMDLTYRVAELEDGCGVIEPRLDLDVVVTLPEWTPSAGANRALVRDWGRFYRALARHEATHRKIAEDEAEALYRRLNGLRRADCVALEAELRHRLQAAQRDIEGAHRDYDERTRHGLTEGAAWPIRPRG